MSGKFFTVDFPNVVQLWLPRGCPAAAPRLPRCCPAAASLLPRCCPARLVKEPMGKIARRRAAGSDNHYAFDRPAAMRCDATKSLHWSALGTLNAHMLIISLHQPASSMDEALAKLAVSFTTAMQCGSAPGKCSVNLPAL